MKEPIVLDSFALLALFHKEPGWQKVRKILRKVSSSGTHALLSRINWGEFYYIVRRRVGGKRAEEALAVIEQLPIQVLPVDDDLVKEAAEIKSQYPVAYADAFCIATAMRVDGAVVTDDPEFKSVQKLTKILWLT